MTPTLLDFLCEPVTGRPLRLVDSQVDESGQIVSGKLVAGDDRVYPIIRGIPRFVPSEQLAQSVSSFGDEWNHFNFTYFKQNWLDHTIANTFGSTQAFKGKLIVDAGGGSGAQTLWMLEAGAKHVIMLDLSNSVDDVVRRNLESSGYRNFDVIQCSIDMPPLRDQSIDGIVYCHNVIQHTPSVENTAKALHALVAPGGEFVFNVYHRNNAGFARWVRFHMIYKPLRAILSKMPFWLILKYAQLMAVCREIPVIGILFEKAGFLIQGDVPKVAGESSMAHLRRRARATTLNTYDWFGFHEYQHHKSEDEVRKLVSTLQPDPAKVLNMNQYFSRPPHIGCALRIFR